MGGVDYSPTVDNAYKAVQLWTLVHARKTGKHPGQQKIRQLACRLAITKPLSCSLEEVIQLLTMSKATYWELKKQAPKLRQECLQERKDEPTISSKAHKKAQQMLLTEKTRVSSRKINWIWKKIQGKSIDKVEWKEENVTLHAETKEDVEQILVAHISE